MTDSEPPEDTATPLKSAGPRRTTKRYKPTKDLEIRDALYAEGWELREYRDQGSKEAPQHRSYLACFENRSRTATDLGRMAIIMSGSKEGAFLPRLQAGISYRNAERPVIFPTVFRFGDCGHPLVETPKELVNRVITGIGSATMCAYKIAVTRYTGGFLNNLTDRLLEIRTDGCTAEYDFNNVLSPAPHYGWDAVSAIHRAVMEQGLTVNGRRLRRLTNIAKELEINRVLVEEFKSRC